MKTTPGGPQLTNVKQHLPPTFGRCSSSTHPRDGVATLACGLGNQPHTDSGLLTIHAQADIRNNRIITENSHFRWTIRPRAALRYLFSMPSSCYRKLYKLNSTTVWQVRKQRLRGSTASRFSPSVAGSTLRSKASESHPHSRLMQEALWVQPAERTGQAGGTENSVCHSTQLKVFHQPQSPSRVSSFRGSPEKWFYLCLFFEIKFVILSCTV